MKQAFEASNENIQSLADRIEISNLLLDLAAAIDANDRAALDHIFTADACIEQSLPAEACSQHQVSNADIHVDKDTAIARTRCHGPDTPSEQVVYYVDKLKRTTEGWRIRERTTLVLTHD